MRIREQRKLRHLTQDDLGKLVNVSAQVVSNWERGYSTPSSEDIQALSKALNVSADYLLCNTDNPQKVLSDNARKFLYIVDLNDDDAVREIQERFMYKGQRIPEQTAREILKFARFNLEEGE